MCFGKARLSFRLRRGHLAVPLATLFLAFTLSAVSAFGQTCDQTAFFPRPIPLGISGGNGHYFGREKGKRICIGGTLGSLVEDPFGKQYILSNNHVLARVNNAQRGSSIVQPGLDDNDCKAGPNNVVANLTKFIKLDLAPDGTNVIDAAIAKIRSDDVTPEILNIGGISNTVVTPTLGLQVQKMGAASCLTVGTISAVNVNVKVYYMPGNKSANFVNQFAITTPASQPFNIPGDSGSIVVTAPTNGSCPQPVGLLFAETTVGSTNTSFQNPMTPVLAALNVELVAACTVSSNQPNDDSAGNALADRIDDAAVTAATLIRDAHVTELMKIPGAVGNGIGIGEDPRQPVLVVYVIKLSDEVRAATPTDIEGIPVHLVETGEIVSY